MLLFVLAFGFVFSGFSQKRAELTFVKKTLDNQEVEGKKTTTNTPHVFNQIKSANEEVNRVVVGMAGSQRSVRRDENHVISYNSELDVISVTVVLDPATYDEADELGVFGQFYSTDHGATWQGPVVLIDQPDASGVENYYPSGIIYNPEGNDDLQSAYGIGQGTLLPPAGEDWHYAVFGSNTIAGNDYNDYEFDETDPDYGYNGYWNQFGLNQIGDEVRSLNMLPKGAWSAFTEIALQPVTGEFNSGVFDWDFASEVDVDLYVDDLGEVYWIGRWDGRDAATEIAWADDGQIGYMWVLGISEDEGTAPQPVMFRTDDAGDSWDEIEVDFFTDEIQEFFEPYLFEIHTGMMIPYAYESAGVVDANGDLQMFMLARSCSADAINYIDSIGYIYTNDYGNIFNVTFDDAGVSGMMWVDSIITDNPGQDPPNYAGNTGWQHRICASKNVDESQVFVTWIESKTLPEADMNIEPNVFGWSKCITTNENIDVISFTEGTIYENYYYFTYGADRAFLNDEGNYSIPYLQTITPTEFDNNGSATADPVTVHYVTGIEFPVLCPVGLEEMAQANSIQVSQNMPNPFTGATTINVSTQTAADVIVEVSNIMGQTIYTINAGIINGTQEIVLPAENLEAGIYFYTVRMGNESISKKMIVE